jgi:hypothetical protein
VSALDWQRGYFQAVAIATIGDHTEHGLDPMNVEIEPVFSEYHAWSEVTIESDHFEITVIADCPKCGRLQHWTDGARAVTDLIRSFGKVPDEQG